MAPNIIRAGTYVQRKGGWDGVKVVYDCVSEFSKPSDSDEEGKEGEEGNGRET